MRARYLPAAIIAIAGVAAPLATLAATYQEVGDAAASIPGQPTFGVGALQRIRGALSDTTDVDIYRLAIVDATLFSATVVGGAAFDTQLFLFDAGGLGITHDDDTPPGGIFPSTLTGAFIPGPGFYDLVITEFDRDPVDAADSLIWNNDPVNVERPPDGPSSFILAGWIGSGNGRAGAYWIQLTGCEAVNQAPQPGTWNESGDAPDVLPGQATSGSGDLEHIFGVLADSLDTDVFCLEIVDAASFSASTSGAPRFDSQLFLFDDAGGGVVFDDDDPLGGTASSRVTGTLVLGPGRFHLAISSFNRKPADASALPIWLDSPEDAERAPDGPGGIGPLSGWIGAGNFERGFYGITLTGARFCTITTGVGYSAEVLSLRTYPNPFNPSVTIVYWLPTASHVSLSLYDVRGKLVRTLVDKQAPPGRYSVVWNRRDPSGRPMAPGVYFARLQSSSGLLTSKIVLVE